MQAGKVPEKDWLGWFYQLEKHMNKYKIEEPWEIFAKDKNWLKTWANVFKMSVIHINPELVKTGVQQKRTGCEK